METNTFHNLKQNYPSLTTVEKSIANFFMSNKEMMDFASRKISKLLYVSEATLSRFSQKVGYSGYREFIFNYTKDLNSSLTKQTPSSFQSHNPILENAYKSLLSQILSLYEEKSLKDILEAIEVAKKIAIFSTSFSYSLLSPLQYALLKLQKDTYLTKDIVTSRLICDLCKEESLIFLIFPSEELLVSLTFHEQTKLIIISDHTIPYKYTNDSITITLPMTPLQNNEILVNPQIPIMVFIDMLIATLQTNTQ